jgi:hypothetical protein
VKNIQRTNPNSTTDNGGDELGQGIGGEPGGIEGQQENSGSETEAKKSVDPQADAAASAAALAIKRLQQDLDRGNVDQKLLDELGWTESDIKSFAERLQKQLAQREANAQQQKEKSISERASTRC